MKSVVFMAGISILDLVITPILLNRIKKTGNFHYLLTTLHKLLFLILVSGVGIFILKNNEPSLLFKFILSASWLFILNSTFEINTHFFNKFNNNKKYNLDGMTEDGKRVMSAVIQNMKKIPEKSLGNKFLEMIDTFLNNIIHDLGVVYMIMAGNSKLKEDYEKLHKIMGNDSLFSLMTMKELLYMVKSRIFIDLIVFALSLSLI